MLVDILIFKYILIGIVLDKIIFTLVMSKWCLVSFLFTFLLKKVSLVYFVFIYCLSNSVFCYVFHFMIWIPKCQIGWTLFTLQVGLWKMSLISQNASTKNVVNKSKREVEDDVENSDTLKVKKKKKYDEGEQLAMEQVKEMKKLENFLFGSLYSPLVFGKDDDDLGIKEID